jgi:hypothetical protein
MRPYSMRFRTSRAVVVALASLAFTGCSKGADKAADTQTPAVTPVDTTTKPVAVADVATGHHIGADKKIVDESGDFAVKDTIFAAVHTTGNQTAKLTARWNYQDGKVVDERSEDIAPKGDAYTEFHIVKPSGWPKGKYTLHVLLNGAEVQSKDVTVK